ncbi:MAG TPA: FAD-binding protein, partial [Polyangiaceae bacterium]|nr:FAD-binding protein [Polyangiaceae bacterium]
DSGDATKDPTSIAEKDRDYYLERIYPAFGNLVPRDIASRAAKKQCDDGKGVGPFVGELRRGVYLDFADAIKRDGKKKILEKYGNLFEMYQRITGDDPSKTPMRIYPASHYTMGGLWVDYNLQSTIDGLFVLGEANFSDHGANRLGASALMQGLADGYFVISYTLGNFLAIKGKRGTRGDTKLAKSAVKAVEEKISELISIGQKGSTHPDVFHRELGALMYDKCGMARNAAGLKDALEEIPKIRERFWSDVKIVGSGKELNLLLEKAGRIGDFLELAELMVHDALDRDESCGAHYREEHVREDGEAKRDDEHFAYAAAWEYTGDLSKPKLHKEELDFEYVKLSQRSYK